MRTQKGYILPALLIIILLILAGFVTFGMKNTPEALAPASESEIAKPVPVVSPKPTSTTPIEESATTTATTSNEVDIGGEAIIQ